MGPTETTSIKGAVPTSGGDPLASIMGDAAAYQKMVRESITPVAGAHTAQVPASLTRPVGAAPQTQGYAQPRNKGQAIANAITSAGNAVSQIITAEKQKKQDHLVDATTKLFQAQALIDEATQQRDSAQATGDTAAALKAQELITQNEKVRDGITIDPKLRKDLAKVLHVNYVDPTENKPEHIAALKKATENVKGWQEKREAIKAENQKQNQAAAQNFGQAYTKSQPQGLAPNVLAQQRIAIEQAQQKVLWEYRGKVDPAYIHAQAANYAEQTRIRAQQDNQARLFAHEEKLKGITLSNEYKLITRRAVVARQLAEQKRIDALSDPLLNFRFDHKEISRLQTENRAFIGPEADLQLQRKALYYTQDGKRPLTNKEIALIQPKIDAIDYQISQLHTWQKNNSDMIQTYTEEADTLQKLHGNNLTEGNDGINTGTSTKSEPSSDELTGSPDDPESFLDQQ